MWSVYDGILSLGPTLKLMGPESYNQVTRHLTSKVFRGVQVHCPTRTSAQFDEPTPVKVHSVVFAIPPSGVSKSRKLPRPWTQLLIKSTQQKRELWEGRWKRTQIHIRWHGCTIVRTLIVMK